MKSWVKLAAAAAIIVMIGIVAFFTRSSWGKLVDGTLTFIVSNVTGQDINIDLFSSAGSSNGDAAGEWTID